MFSVSVFLHYNVFSLFLNRVLSVLALNHMKEEYSVDAFPSVADLVINSHIAMVWYDSLEVLNVYLSFSFTGV